MTKEQCQECENLKHDLEGYMDANKELINKEWQGLTDDERIKCYETSGHKQHIRPQDRFAILELSIAIEQALKEKNHG